MLRPVSRNRITSEGQTDRTDSNASLNEAFDERQGKRAMSLRIFDGDIRLSCGGSGKSTISEEREIDFDESTETINKLPVYSNENIPVDSISVSSELDREFETSDLSGDGSSLASHEGIPEIDEESPSDYQADVKDSEVEYVTTNDVVGSIDTESDGSFTSKNDTGGSIDTALESDAVRMKESMTEKRQARIYDGFIGYGNFQEEEKGLSKDRSRKSDGQTSNDENQIEEKPAGKEKLLHENEYDDGKKGVFKENEPHEIRCNSSYGSIMKKIDSLSVDDGDNDDEIQKDDAIRYYEKELSRSRECLEGEPPSQNIIKCLVSLTTPRDLLSVSSCEQPAFVEFDMSHDGFGYLFIGNLTPIITQGAFFY